MRLLNRHGDRTDETFSVRMNDFMVPLIDAVNVKRSNLHALNRNANLLNMAQSHFVLLFALGTRFMPCQADL